MTTSIEAGTDAPTVVSPDEGRQGRPSGARPRWLRRPTWSGIGTLLAVAVLLLLVGVPVWSILENSFRNGTPFAPGSFTLSHFAEFAQDAVYREALLNTIVIAAIALVTAVPLGFLLAWLAARTDVPLQRVMQIGNVIPYLFPTFIGAIGWAYLAQPGSGLLNIMLRSLDPPAGPFNVYTRPAIGVILGVFLAPITYLICSGALSNMNAQMEEAASTFGLSHWRALRGITMPLMKPALVSSAVLTVALTMEDFGVPQILGTPAHIQVLMTQIYAQQVYSQPTFGPSGVAALLMLVIAGLLGAYYRRSTRMSRRFATVTGKSSRPARLALGKWRYPALSFWIFYFLVATILPFGTLAYVSLRPYPGLGTKLTWSNYTTVLHDTTMLRSIHNSVIYTSIGAVIAMLLAVAVALIVSRRKRSVVARTVDTLSVLPLAIPGVVLGLAVVDFWVSVPLEVYGTAVIVIIVFVTRYFPLGQRAVMSALTQTSPDLEEAAKVSGSRPAVAFCKVTVPLMGKSLLAAFILIWILMFREVVAVIFVNSYGHELLSVMVLEEWTQGQFTDTAALAMIEALIAIVAMAILLVINRGLSGSRSSIGGDL